MREILCARLRPPLFLSFFVVGIFRLHRMRFHLKVGMKIYFFKLQNIQFSIDTNSIRKSTLFKKKNLFIHYIAKKVKKKEEVEHAQKI